MKTKDLASLQNLYESVHQGMEGSNKLEELKRELHKIENNLKYDPYAIAFDDPNYQTYVTNVLEDYDLNPEDMKTSEEIEQLVELIAQCRLIRDAREEASDNRPIDLY
jgi:hypothetical protein